MLLPYMEGAVTTTDEWKVCTVHMNVGVNVRTACTKSGFV